MCIRDRVEIETDERKGFSYWFAKSVAVTVSLILAYASFKLVKTESEYPRDILPGIPVWVVEVIMPLGFFFIAMEMLRTSKKEPVFRALLIAIPIVIGVIGLGETLQTPVVLWAGVIVVLLSLAFGAPIFIGLGGLAVLFFWHDGVPIAAVPAEMYRIVVSPTLPTIPLFTLAGYILAQGGASKRLVEVFRHWFGWIPGGTPVMITLLCGFFTTLTGGSGVTILALGGLLLPMLISEKYPREFSVGLITVSGSLGLLFPPSLPAIIYGATLGDGNEHDPHDLPTLIAGGGGGTIKSGRAINFQKPTDLAGLHLSMLKRLGVRSDRFGNSSTPMQELDA